MIKKIKSRKNLYIFLITALLLLSGTYYAFITFSLQDIDKIKVYRFFDSITTRKDGSVRIIELNSLDPDKIIGYSGSVYEQTALADFQLFIGQKIYKSELEDYRDLIFQDIEMIDKNNFVLSIGKYSEKFKIVYKNISFDQNIIDKIFDYLEDEYVIMGEKMLKLFFELGISNLDKSYYNPEFYDYISNDFKQLKSLYDNLSFKILYWDSNGYINEYMSSGQAYIGIYWNNVLVGIKEVNLKNHNNLYTTSDTEEYVNQHNFYFPLTHRPYYYYTYSYLGKLKDTEKINIIKNECLEIGLNSSNLNIFYECKIKSFSGNIINFLVINVNDNFSNSYQDESLNKDWNYLINAMTTKTVGNERIIELKSVAKDKLIMDNTGFRNEESIFQLYLNSFRDNVDLVAINLNFILEDNNHIKFSCGKYNQVFKIEFDIYSVDIGNLKDILKQFNNIQLNEYSHNLNYRLDGKEYINAFLNGGPLIGNIVNSGMSSINYIKSFSNIIDIIQSSIKNVSFKTWSDDWAGDHDRAFVSVYLGIYVEDILVAVKETEIFQDSIMCISNKYDNDEKNIREYIGNNLVEYEIIPNKEYSDFFLNSSEEKNVYTNIYKSYIVLTDDFEWKPFDIVLNNGKKETIFVYYFDDEEARRYSLISNAKEIERIFNNISNSDSDNDLIILPSIDPDKLVRNYYSNQESYFNPSRDIQMIYDGIFNTYLISVLKGTEYLQTDFSFVFKNKNLVTISIGGYTKDFKVGYSNKDVDYDKLDKIAGEIQDSYGLSGTKLIRKLFEYNNFNGVQTIINDSSHIYAFSSQFNSLEEKYNIKFSVGLWGFGGPLYEGLGAPFFVYISLDDVIVGVKEVTFSTHYNVWIDNSYSSFEEYLGNELKINLSDYKIKKSKLNNEENDYFMSQQYAYAYNDLCKYEITNKDNFTFEIYVIRTSKQVADILNSVNNEYEYDYEKKGKYKITSFNNSLDELINILDISKEMKSVHYDKKRNIVTDNFLRTGDIIEFYDDDKQIIYSYIIIVEGDVSGDGNISALDYIKIKNHIMQVGVINDDIILDAADINEDGKITALDYVTIKNIIMNGE